MSFFVVCTLTIRINYCKISLDNRRVCEGDMVKQVIVTADKVRKRKRRATIVKIALLSLLLLMAILYFILQIIYNEGRFTISLDSNKTLESGIAIYETLDDPQPKRKLEANALSFMDNISEKWLPEDINTEADGSHNGENYIAYSFYVENQGDEKLHYWYEVIVEDVIKNVDEAIRIMIYQNDDKQVFAKKNGLSNKSEEGTTAFLERNDGTVVLQQRKNFKPNDRDRYTIVIWLEGDDPDCVDALKGGELKVRMKITEEHIPQEQ